MELDATFNALGPRLRQLRLSRNVSLAALADETGISASTLSRLESGRRRPTLEQLLPLARAYNVTLDELVDAPPTGNPRINLRPVTNDDGSVVIPLTRRAGGIQAFKFVLRAATREVEPHLRVHDGYEWVYVLDGRLRLVLGDQDLVLEPGEAAEFETATPHWFGATRSGPVEFLSLFGNEGQHAHIRATDRPRPT